MNKLSRALHSEFVAGRTPFDWCFLATGLAIQIVVFCLAPSASVNIVSGIAGIFSVILCSQGKISSYFFGFLQVITYLIISYRQHLYGEVGINVFYFLSMIYGLFVWKSRYRVDETTGSAELHARKLSVAWWITIIALVTLGTILTGWFLDSGTDDSDPYLDAFTTIPAIAGQILMVFGYREQWFFWFCIDIASVWLWVRAGNWSMAALYAFWCANCINGFYHWTNSAKQHD